MERHGVERWLVTAREAKTEEEKGGKVEAEDMDTTEHVLSVEVLGTRRQNAEESMRCRRRWRSMQAIRMLVEFGWLQEWRRQGRGRDADTITGMRR